MKSIIIIHFCLILLTNGSYTAEREKLIRMLNKLAEKKGEIDGIFRPSKDGFLGQIVHSVTYKGILIPTGVEVSMKFTTDKDGSKTEYNMYTYLNAINDSSVEVYGIPSIHYYGTWENYTLIAMTLFDREFYKSNVQKRGETLTEMDMLIIFRDYVRITKYMYSRCVFHSFIKFETIMFRKGQCFFYDFTDAHVMNNAHPHDRLLSAQSGWQLFLSALYFLVHHPLYRYFWIGLNPAYEWDRDRMDGSERFRKSLLEDGTSKESDKFNGLRKVFVEFARYAYDRYFEPTTPFHDILYKLIVEQIAAYAAKQRKPPFPSWLSEKDKIGAGMFTIPPISDMPNPFTVEDLKYNKVDYEKFSELDSDRPSSKGEPERKKSGCFLKWRNK